MKNEDIIKIVIEYITEERYKQAILIDGEWGAGKTFFVKEQLLDHNKLWMKFILQGRINYYKKNLEIKMEIK